MKKQVVVILGILTIASMAEAQRVKQVGTCVIHERTKCDAVVLDSSAHDLDRARLKHASFKGAEITGSETNRFDMRGADLTRANFSNSTFEYVNANGVKLERTDFQNSKIGHSFFSNVNVGRYVNFMNSTMNDVSISRSHLQDSNFQGVSGSNFFAAEAELWDANFRDTKLERADFTGADLRQADFSDATLQNANFNDANLEGVSFKCAELKKANFKESRFTQINLEGANLEGATFDNASRSLFEAHLCGTYLDGRYQSTVVGCDIKDGEAPSQNFCGKK